MSYYTTYAYSGAVFNITSIGEPDMEELLGPHTIHWDRRWIHTVPSKTTFVARDESYVPWITRVLAKDGYRESKPKQTDETA